MPLQIVLFTLGLSLFFSSCARHPRPPQAADLRADTKLGARETQDEAEEARKSLEELQEKQLQEQKRQLERHINDPLAQ